MEDSIRVDLKGIVSEGCGRDSSE